MSISDKTTQTHDSLQEAIKGLIDTQFQLLMMTQQSSQVFSAAIAALSQAMSAPRKLITDAAGNPVGVVSQIEQGNPNV